MAMQQKTHQTGAAMAAWLIALFIAFLLAGCGESSNSNNSGSAANTQNPNEGQDTPITDGDPPDAPEPPEPSPIEGDPTPSPEPPPSTEPDPETPNIPEGLPPDPGEAGKATLEGVDSDNDGVRDDLQRYIAIEYQESTNIRAVLTDMVKADQDFLRHPDNKEKVLEARERRSHHIACVFHIDPEGAYDKLTKLNPEVLNTEERIRASIRADSQLGGMTFLLPDDEELECNVDLDTPKN